MMPSWVNEKRANVNANKVVRDSVVSGLVSMLIFGLMGAMAFPLVTSSGTKLPGADSILNFLDGQSKTPRCWAGQRAELTKFTVYLWNLFTLVPGIPVQAIMCKYNLVNEHICGPKVAFFTAVVLPWVLVAFLYETR